MREAIFISYGHADMDETNWIERLKRYLVPLERSGIIDVWDDSRIEAGCDWQEQIGKSLDDANVAILLIGPGFLASDFIMKRELPTLLQSSSHRGMRIFPVVIGYCGYENSELAKFQAVNEPSRPLESLSTPDQNKILNHIAVLVGKALRTASEPSVGDPGSSQLAKREGVRQIARLLNDTRTAFIAQCRRRDDLVERLQTRLRIRSDLQFEKLFFRYYPEMNEEERFEFEMIRAITEGPLHDANRQILGILEDGSDLLDDSPMWVQLRQHLVFWLNKFDRVFRSHKAMCLLYTGVEDGVPFPPNVDDFVRDWLTRNGNAHARD